MCTPCLRRHEYMESFGLSHYHAVVSEVLLDTDARLPQRISYQLAHMTGNGLLGVRAHFGPQIERDAALLIDISTKWKHVPAAVRRYVVDLLERYYDVADDVLITQTLDQAALPAADDITMNDVHVYLRAIGSQTDELQESPGALLRTYVARSCLGYELALRINEVVDVMLDQTTAEDYVDERLVLEETFAEDVTLSHTRWLVYRLLNFLRLLFMSMTADPRFGREMYFGHASPRILTPLMPYLYWVARHLYFALANLFLWNAPKGMHAQKLSAWSSMKRTSE